MQRTILPKLLLITLAALHATEAKKNVVIALLQFKCKVYSAKVSRLDCSLNKTPQNITKLSVYFEPAQDIYFKNVQTKIDVILNKKRQTMMDHSINVCDMLQGVSTFFGLKLFIDVLKDPKISNVPESCPLQKGKVYFIKDFLLDVSDYQPYTPNFKFNHTAHFRENNELLMYSELLGEFKPKTQTNVKKIRSNTAKKGKK